MKLPLYVVSVLCLIACAPVTFEARLKRKTFYESAGRDMRSIVDRTPATIYFDNLSYCHTIEESNIYKRTQASRVDVAAANLFRLSAEKADSLLGAIAGGSVLDTISTGWNINYCALDIWNQDWDDHVNSALKSIPVREPRTVSMQIVGRTITFYRAEMDMPMQLVFVPSGDVEYFASTSWAVVLFQDSVEVYRGYARSKHYFIQSEEEPFLFRLGKQQVDSLMSIALRDFVVR